MSLLSLPERIQNKIEPEPNSGCWLWTGILSGQGYGLLWVDGKMRSAHRQVWFRERGSVPQGCELDHRCRTRSCVNPDHLRAVSHRDNLAAPGSLSFVRINLDKTCCPKGHSYHRLSGGDRGCRECNRARMSNGRPRQQEYRGPRASREDCPRGHRYSPENTHFNRQGFRSCRSCHRERENARLQQKYAQGLKRRVVSGKYTWVRREA